MGHYLGEMACNKCVKIPCICPENEKFRKKDAEYKNKIQQEIYNWIKRIYSQDKEK